MTTAIATRGSIVDALAPDINEDCRRGMEVFRDAEGLIRNMFQEEAETFAKVILQCLRTNPQLRECSPASFAAFLQTCAELQLMPGRLGMIYPLPFRSTKLNTVECTTIIGYKGLAELARRSGEIREMAAEVVYRDEIESGKVRLSRQPPDVHHPFIPAAGARKDADIVAAYCVVSTHSGGRFISILDRWQIDERRDRSPSKNASSSPWKTDYAKMARKTAIRDLLQGGTVPLSTQMKRAVELDEPDVIDVGDVETAPVHQPQTLRGALGVDERMREPGEE